MPPGQIALATLEILVVLTITWAVLLTPDNLGHFLARVAGVMFAPLLASMAWRDLHGPRRRRARGVGALFGALLAVAFAVEPQRFETTLTRITGIGLIVAAIAIEWRIRGLRDDESVRRLHGWAILLTLVGTAFVVLPTAAFNIAVWLIVVALAARMLLSASRRLGAIDLDDDPDRPLLIHWIDSKLRSEEDRGVLYDQLYFEGLGAPGRLARFVLMMFFASVISAMGVLTDSTAVVIGAMLIAPLINPMMGMGLALTMGWPNRLRRSALIVLLGTMIAVGCGWLLAMASDLVVDVDRNSQILSRASPAVSDLVIAVAAGAAGAYAMSRRDLSSSLPGVAVAIALVPPLSVVGITAQARAWDDARGTSLLFLTNFVAIVLVGGIVFVLTGIAPLRRLASNQLRVRTSAAAIAVLAILIVGALVFNGHQIASNSLARDNAQRAVLEWLGDGTEFSVQSLSIDGRSVEVVLVGPGDPPSEQHLARALEDELGHGVELLLRWTPQEVRRATAD